MPASTVFLAGVLWRRTTVFNKIQISHLVELMYAALRNVPDELYPPKIKILFSE